MSENEIIIQGVMEYGEISVIVLQSFVAFSAVLYVIYAWSRYLCYGVKCTVVTVPLDSTIICV